MSNIEHIQKQVGEKDPGETLYVSTISDKIFSEVGLDISPGQIHFTLGSMNCVNQRKDPDTNISYGYRKEETSVEGCTGCHFHPTTGPSRNPCPFSPVNSQIIQRQVEVSYEEMSRLRKKPAEAMLLTTEAFETGDTFIFSDLKSVNFVDPALGSVLPARSAMGTDAPSEVLGPAKCVAELDEKRANRIQYQKVLTPSRSNCKGCPFNPEGERIKDRRITRCPIVKRLED